MDGAVEFIRVALVVSLLCAAGVLAAPKGALPLALRGLAGLLAGDAGKAREDVPPVKGVSPMRRFLAFLSAVAAFAVAVWR